MKSKFKYVEIGEVKEENDGEFKDIDSPETTSKKINELKQDIDNNKDLFLFIFMEGCGPCNMTKPGWKNLKKLNQNGVTIVLLNQKLLNKEDYKEYSGKINSLIGSEPSGFPTLRYIKGKSNNSDYQGERSEKAFKEWIHKKTGLKGNSMREKIENGKFGQVGNLQMMGGANLMGGARSIKGRSKSRKTRKMRMRMRQRAGKWSMKYKKSINCKKPKGFSQKQHCKYGRK